MPQDAWRIRKRIYGFLAFCAYAENIKIQRWIGRVSLYIDIHITQKRTRICIYIFLLILIFSVYAPTDTNVYMDS